MATAQNIIEKRDQLRKKLSQVDRLIGGKSDAERKSQTRKRDRDISLPRVADMSRRADCLDDIFTFLKVYFPEIFSQKFTPDRIEMLEAIIFAARFSGDQAVAGPRGEGKTRNALYASLWLCLRGELRFPIIIGKNATRSATDMKSLKEQLQFNALLADDFPEVCIPIRELEGWASRARMQTVNGEFTRIEWGADHVILPTVADRDTESAACGQIIASLGVEGPIRGITFRDERPDLAIIDDVDDRQSAKSFTQTEDRERIIDQDILGLSGPGKRISRVMLCTMLNNTCIAATYTDPKKKPSWRGKRFKALVKKPDNEDRWEEYIQLRKENSEDDPHYRVAGQFYIDNQEEMDAGAVVANPENYDDSSGSDGEPLEISALQAIYNIIADVGWDNFATEYQNDPPAGDVEETSGMVPRIVRESMNGRERRVVPNESQKLTAFIDVAMYRHHYIVASWKNGGTGCIVDYGEKSTPEPKRIGRDKAILIALREMRDEWLEDPYLNEDGEPVTLNLCLVDSRYADSAVYQFTQESGAGFMPSSGSDNEKFRQPPNRTADKRPGTVGWYQVRRDKGAWVIAMHSDYWKHIVHNSLLMKSITEGGLQAPGSITLYGDEDQSVIHRDFAQQICAEIFTKEWKDTPTGGKVFKEYWKKIEKNNHYLDCLYGVAVAASVCGIEMTNTRAKSSVVPVKRAGGKKSDLFLERPGGWVQGMR